MRLRNLRPGEWEITPIDKPTLVVSGEFDVDDDDLARSLLEQHDNYEPVDAEAKALSRQLAGADRLAEHLDEMHANEVIAQLAGLDHDHLAVVRAAEQAGKARKTVLDRIAELTAAAGGKED